MGRLHAARPRLLPEARSRSSAAPARLHQRLRVNCPSGHPASESQRVRSWLRAGGFPSTQRKGLRVEEPPCRQLEIVSKGTVLDKPGLTMSLSGCKSPRGFAVFRGVHPRRERRVRGCWLSRTHWCGVSLQVHPYFFLQFRVSLKPSPSTGWTSPGATPLPSRSVKKLLGNWGRVGL